MAPPPGRLGDAVKLPVQVRMFPEEIAMVDAFAVELSQQSYGAAFSRAEALRIAAMEWLKGRQAALVVRHALIHASCLGLLNPAELVLGDKPLQRVEEAGRTLHSGVCSGYM